MAKQVFKQFKQVTSAFTEWENGVLYFVRTAADKGDGFVRFNGKIYGSGEDVKADLEALIGELPSGQTDIVTWLESVSFAITAEAAARTAMDAALLGDATASTTTNATIYDVKRAVDAITGSSHSHSNLEVLNGITAEKVAAWDAAEDNASAYTDKQIAALDATVSGASNGVEVQVVEADGKITNVNVTAPDFANTYDAKGAADAAFSAATANTASQISTAIATETARTESIYAKPADITSAIEALDASAVTIGANETVASISETDGVITVTKQDIAISHSAVTDWDTELAKKQDTLVFKTAYDADTNKAVTESDIAFLEGAMHFIGISSTDPSQGDPTIPGVSAFTSGDVCLYGTKEFIYDGTTWREIGDEGIYVTKTTTIAGVDLQDNISKAELLSALTVEEGAQVNVVETIKVNGTAITVTDKAVDIAIAEGSSAGTISVAGVDVPVHGLGSMAFENAADFAAASALTALSGNVETAIETASAATLAAATADTAAQISSAITNLDATVSGASSGNVTTVEVVEADGKITAVNVSNNLSADADNALSVKSDGLFAAIYYEDDDNE